MYNYGLTTRKPYKTTIFDAFDDLFGSNIDTTLKSKIMDNNDWVFETNDDGGILTISALGHNPDDIEITVADSILKIKATKPEDASSLVTDLDYSFTINSKYSSEDVKASFKNGMVMITFGFKEESKPKRIEITQ